MNEIIEFFKTTFMDEFQSAMTGERIASALLVSFFLSIFAVIIYKLTYTGVAFNRAYAFSLVLASMVTAVIIMTVTTNLALSLGMVGALSIVRFRTAIKEPNDTVYMFWTICIGIMAGAGLIYAAIIANVCVGVLYYLLYLILKSIKGKPYLLVIKFNNENEAEITEAVSLISKAKLKSKIITADNTEITLSISYSAKNTELIESIGKMQGVYTCALVSYNGDTTL